MPEVKPLVTKNEFKRFPIRNESARPSCLPDSSPSPSFAPSRGRLVSLGGGSFSSHVTEEKRTGLQPGISPLCGTAIPGCAPIHLLVCPRSAGLQPGISPLCGTAIPGCAPLSAHGVHRDSVLAAASPTRHLPSRMVLRDEAVGLRRETASSSRFMRRNLSSLRARSAGLQPGISLFVAQPFLAVRRSSSSRPPALVAPGFSPAFPSLWHSHSWLCSWLHTWRPLRPRPSRTKPHPSFAVPDGFAGRIGPLAQRDRFLSAVYAEKSLFSSGA